MYMMSEGHWQRCEKPGRAGKSGHIAGLE